MPYKSIEDLPDNIKSSLPVPAQRVWMSVFNQNFAKGEEEARKVAWTAVKNGWEKEDDDWVRKNAHGFNVCMADGCDAPPETDVIWANGKGRAWFCAADFEKWSGTEFELNGNTHTYGGDINKQAKIADGVAPQSFSEHNPAERLNSEPLMNTNCYMAAYSTRFLSSCIRFEKQGNVLHFTGIGFQHGSWHGIDGHPTTYSEELVRENADSFAMKRIKSGRLSVHGKTDKDVVGWVTTKKLLSNGMVKVSGVVMDQEEIEFIMAKQVAGIDIGISPEFMAPSNYDPHTRMYTAYALDVTGYCFVDNPACKVCYVGDTRLLSEKKETKKHMSSTGKELTPEQLEEINTFYTGQLAEGKTFEEIKAANFAVPATVVNNVVAPVEPVVAQPAPIPGAPVAPAAPAAVLSDEDNTRLNAAIEAGKKVDGWEANQRLLAEDQVTEKVAEIKKLDATFNAERMLAHFGEDPYKKLAFLTDEIASKKHFLESLPEPARELAGPVGDDKIRELAGDFGVEFKAGMTLDDIVTAGAEALK